MKIADILDKTSILINKDVKTKKELLVYLSRLAQERTGQSEHNVLEALVERERLGTTGIGKGIALPHIRLKGLNKIYCAFIKVNPMDFESVDGRQVDLVFFLAVPEEAGSDHLKALSHLSRLARNDALTVSLRKTDNIASLYPILTENDVDD